MNRRARYFGIVLAATVSGIAMADETPYGKGMTEANRERLVLDDMEDVSDWYNGSPDETTLSASGKHAEGGGKSLLFANVVDHTKGEKNYPIGWPRTGKNLDKLKLTDFSPYDSFECWIYTETSRESLPGQPLGVGFYHSGSKRSTSIRLDDVAKDRWVKVAVPITRLDAPADVQRVQFNIAESNYKHGDRVDFYIGRMVLVRYVEPAVAQLAVDRKVLYSSDREITALYRLAGYKGMDDVKVEFSIGPAGGEPVAKSTAKAIRSGELPLAIAKTLDAGKYTARLDLRDADGRLIDRAKTEFRVIRGPF